MARSLFKQKAYRNSFEKAVKYLNQLFTLIILKKRKTQHEQMVPDDCPIFNIG